MPQPAPAGIDSRGEIDLREKPGRARLWLAAVVIAALAAVASLAGSALEKVRLREQKRRLVETINSLYRAPAEDERGIDIALTHACGMEARDGRDGLIVCPHFPSTGSGRDADARAVTTLRSDSSGVQTTPGVVTLGRFQRCDLCGSVFAGPEMDDDAARRNHAEYFCPSPLRVPILTGGADGRTSANDGVPDGVVRIGHEALPAPRCGDACGSSDRDCGDCCAPGRCECKKPTPDPTGATGAPPQ